MIHTAFPGFRYSIEELIAAEDRVISQFIFRGTHEGEFQEIPATGNKIEFSEIMITRIENGKIVEDKEELDQLSMMIQLGMELKPKGGTSNLTFLVIAMIWQTMSGQVSVIPI